MPIHDWARVKAGIVHDFHHEWISTIKRALNTGLLPPDYDALAEQVAGGLGPDVLTLENVHDEPARASGNGPEGVSGAPGQSGVALAAKPPKVSFTAVAELEQYSRKRSRIAIRHSSSDQIVAVIEIVSPGNKASGHALRSFVEKAIELLDAGIHLLNEPGSGRPRCRARWPRFSTVWAAPERRRRPPSAPAIPFAQARGAWLCSGVGDAGANSLPVGGESPERGEKIAGDEQVGVVHLESLDRRPAHGCPTDKVNRLA